jgi:hypothetical protein
VLITVFHFLDLAFGPYARYPIAFIGLFPLLLVIYFGGEGDAIYMRNIVFSGLAWSAAWLATSYIFSRVPHNSLAFVLMFLLMLPSASIVIAAVTERMLFDLGGSIRHASRDEPKVFGEITGAKMLRCRNHECIVLTCREHKCVETGRLVPKN